MKVAITTGKGDIALADAPEPTLGPWQCLCKITACASCTGTDQKLIKGQLGGAANYPGIVGHESVGYVVKTGAKVRHIKEGEVFLRPISVYPGERLGSYGSLWGGYAEYGLVTDVRAFTEDHPGQLPNNFTKYQQPMPKDHGLSWEDMSMLITLKELASFLANLKPAFYSSLAVLGTGTVAMSAVYFAKLMGQYPVIALGRREDALEAMKGVGADHVVNLQTGDPVKAVKAACPGGVDLVVDTTGDSEVAARGLELAAPGGRVFMYAVPQQGEVKLSWSQLGGRSIGMEGPRENLAHQYLVDLARLKAVPFKKFYSHAMPLTAIAKGFELLKSKQATKIAFTMD